MKRIQLLVVLFFATHVFAQKDSSFLVKKNTSASWLQTFNFNLSSFKNPSQLYGPMARWWWPGNDVTKEELRREINLFADNGFAGVEVQPMNLALPPMSEEERKKVTGWDTPEYYDNLKAVMEEARKRKLVVDMTNGSGWPPAAPNLQPEDGFLSLEFSDTTITGGKALSFVLPQLNTSKNRTKIFPRLQSVVIARILPKVAGENATIHLEDTSSKVITSFVKENTLSYSFSEGNWKVIAFWAVAAGSQTNIGAAPKPMTVVDHFDSLKVLKLYNYLFGERTGLQPYFGNPMRAIFSDSYEFVVNRHYALNFIPYFLKKRGYDITAYLPANMQKGYNYVSYMRPNTQPDFSFSDQDWRLRYDYDITLGEILGDQFFKTSKTWTEKRNLLFRTQAYGLNMDMIAMAGLASIPETESMLGSEANLKVMTSGALLYNRPIVSAESVVFSGRAYTTTPQKIKLAVDKLFSVGVNQIIYHGVPYHYTSDKLGPEGWYPFSSAFLGSINFSSNLGEGNIFWKDQKEVNEYVSRVQAALRAGKPHADVLLYYPFLDIGEGTLSNDEEILTTGYIKEVDGALPKKVDDHNPSKTAWAQKVFPLINQLEANGISWTWVNDASIQAAAVEKDGQINVRGNHFQALILANDSIIQIKTAQQINVLAKKGMRLLATVSMPNKQPSFLNWKEHDTKTAQYISTALKEKNSRYLTNEDGLGDWMKQLKQQVAFRQPYHFTRQAQRDMNDGSRLHFIWNKSNEWQTLSLTLDKKYKSSYWMNAGEGTITKNTGSTITYQLPPYGSVILYAAAKNDVADERMFTPAIAVDDSKSIRSIDKWNIKVDSVEIKDTVLFDWKLNEQLKFSSAEGIYTSTFQWQQSNSSRHFFLDLGKVCFTAEVYINGKLIGKRIYSPYLFDVSTFLKEGVNEIKIQVTPGQLNSFIGNAKNGDGRYRQFKGKEDQVMSAGLIGPVVIRPEK
jgi:hypothetical protein